MVATLVQVVGEDGTEGSSASNPFPVREELRNSDWRSIDVAPGATATLQTSAGAAGDFLMAITLIPLTTSPGQCTLTNGSGDAVIIFQGGTDSVGDLSPRTIMIYGCSVGGAWSLTMGTNIRAKASGLFS